MIIYFHMHVNQRPLIAFFVIIITLVSIAIYFVNTKNKTREQIASTQRQLDMMKPAFEQLAKKNAKRETIKIRMISAVPSGVVCQDYWKQGIVSGSANNKMCGDTPAS